MGSNLNNTIAVIPSFNEARQIGVIVRNIVNMGMSVLVIDDGSTDNTQREALDNGAMVLRNKKNLGKGYSIRQGIQHVLEKTNFDWMVMMDGDGQHHTEDLPVLMGATQVDDTDIVTGNRMLQTESMPRVRYLTNRFMSWIISGICRQDIPDTQCGYRLLRTSAMKKLPLISENYDIETEMLIEAARLGMKIRSVPIQTIYGDEISQINPFVDTIRFFRLIIRNLFLHHG